MLRAVLSANEIDAQTWQHTSKPINVPREPNHTEGSPSPVTTLVRFGEWLSSDHNIKMLASCTAELACKDGGM